MSRPVLRGWSHALAFLVAIPAGVMLIIAAEHPLEITAASIYVATILISFGTSAAYHRLARTPRATAVMQRLDHAGIYLLIAGTYVPTCLIGLPLRWGIPLLSVVGVGAVAGLVLKIVAFHHLQWLGYALYPLLGWAALGAMPALVESLAPLTLALILAGGVAYTAGMPVLLLKRPDPWPRVFGYHEVWHVFTIVAAVLHFGAVYTLVG